MADALAASPMKGVVSHGMGIVTLELTDDIFDVGGTLGELPAHNVNFVRVFNASLSSSEYRLEFTQAARSNFRLYLAMAVASAGGVAAYIGPGLVAYAVSYWARWTSEPQ